MEKRLNVTMGETGARVDISGTPLDIVFMMGIVILDIHKALVSNWNILVSFLIGL